MNAPDTTGPVYNAKKLIKQAATEDQRHDAWRTENENALSRVADYTLREVTL